ncbi:MAG TPA: hypothetical protein VIS73_01655 [Rhodocyclaceae bacterium]
MAVVTPLKRRASDQSSNNSRQDPQIAELAARRRAQLAASNNERAAAKRQQVLTTRLAVAAAFVCLAVLAVIVATQGIYEPGDDFGYTLGLIGGLLLLSQMVYPLRKRIPLLARLGMMNSWFRYHMLIGVAAPLLILFHSTFKTGSTNGSIAMYTMLLVAASGLVGRFFYVRVNHGLYGRHRTLGDVTAALQSSLNGVQSVFAIRADLEPRLMAFHRWAFESNLPLWRRAWRFATVRYRGRRLNRRLRKDAKRALRRRRRDDHVDKAELMLSYQLAKQQFDRFIDVVVDASQFRLWERMLSVWHLIHIPFIYLLLFSGLVHVAAVHMY